MSLTMMTILDFSMDKAWDSGLKIWDEISLCSVIDSTGQELLFRYMRIF